MNKPKMRYVNYGRVSSVHQKEEETIEMQKDALRSFAEYNHLTIIDEYYDEAQSGSLPFANRPEGQRLLTDAKAKKFDAVLFYRTDRLGRSAFEGLRICQQLSDLGVAIRSISENYDTSTPTGKLVFTMLLALAENELSTIKKRMNDGKQRKLRRGLGGAVGRAPYGYTQAEDKKLIIDNTIVYANKTKADIVRYIYDATIAENISTIALANRLNSMQVPGPISRWNCKKVLDIIKSPIYKGVAIYNGRSSLYDNLIEIQVPPIVNPEIWSKANAGIQKRKIFNRQKNNNHHYLLGQGLMRCGSCGHAYTGIYYKDRSPTTTNRFYKCNGRTMRKYKELQGKPVCKRAMPIPADWIENVVWDECCKLLTRPKYAEKVIQAYYVRSSQPELLETNTQAVSASIGKLEQERQDLISLCLKKIITDDDLSNRLSMLDKQIEELKNMITKDMVVPSSRKFDEEIKNTRNAIQILKAVLPQADDFDVKRALVQALVHSVIITTNEDKSFDVDINLNFGPQGLGQKIKSHMQDINHNFNITTRQMSTALETLKNSRSFNTCFGQAGIDRAYRNGLKGQELVFRR